jgi:ADP-ribose pyrophosphatase YjhB (NUDIX family)
MKRQLVGGILVKDGRILLIKRATSDPRLEAAWSLPMGDVKDNESHDQALTRVLADMTGLDVRISRKLLVHDRYTSETTLFAISLVGTSSIADDSANQERAFFAFAGLPQNLFVDSLLCIVKYQLIESRISEHPFNIIDRVFASIFYSCIAPHFKQFDVASEVEIYRYIVVSTPYRKFKSVVPFLMSRCNHEVSHLFLLPELCFAVWTLLDDCHDETLYRYGCESTLLKFGKRASVIALFTSLHNLRGFLDRTISPSNVNRIVAALVQSASALLQRGHNSLDTDIDTYLDQSAARTEFLRAAWVSVLEECGYDPAKREILYDIQLCSSRIGQLINDYFDIDRGQLQDFDRRVASAHGLLLSGQASEEDRGLLRALWLGQGGKDRYLALLERYDIRRVLSHMIRDALVGIVARIQQSGFDNDEKAVLIAWHQMSFVQFNQEVNDVRLLSPFLESIDRMLYKYELSGVSSACRCSACVSNRAMPSPSDIPSATDARCFEWHALQKAAIDVQ